MARQSAGRSDTSAAPPDSTGEVVLWDAPEIAETIREAGLRPTAARCWIVALLRTRRVHPTVEELRHLLREQEHEVRQATLYQSLSKLAEADVISSFVDADGLLRFDADVESHPHMICTSCGRVADLEPSAAEKRRIHGLVSDLSRAQPEWRVDSVHLELKSLCPLCAARNEA